MQLAQEIRGAREKNGITAGESRCPGCSIRPSSPRCSPDTARKSSGTTTCARQTTLSPPDDRRCVDRLVVADISRQGYNDPQYPIEVRGARTGLT